MDLIEKIEAKLEELFEIKDTMSNYEYMKKCAALKKLWEINKGIDDDDEGLELGGDV